MRLFMLTGVGIGFFVLATLTLCRTGGPLDSPEGGLGVECPDSSYQVHGPNPLLKRAAAKHEIALSVLRGEIGLLQGAASVRDLFGNDRVILIGLMRKHPQASDEELYAWNLIYEIEAELGDRPLFRAIHAGRLQAELPGYSAEPLL